MAKLIFTKLYDSLSDIVFQIKEKTLLGENTELEEKQKNALLRLLKFALEDDSWLSHKTSKEKVRFFIKSGCNYGKTQEYFQTRTRNSIESSMSTFGKKFEIAIGPNTFDLILDGQVSEAMKQFKIAKNKSEVSDLYSSELLSFLPNPEKHPFSLEECIKELRILKSLTVTYQEQLIKKGDVRKLAFLIYLLNSTEKEFMKEHTVLQEFFNEQFSLDQEGHYLKINDQLSKAFEEFLKLDFINLTKDRL